MKTYKIYCPLCGTEWEMKSGETRRCECEALISFDYHDDFYPWRKSIKVEHEGYGFPKEVENGD